MLLPEVTKVAEILAWTPVNLGTQGCLTQHENENENTKVKTAKKEENHFSRIITLVAHKLFWLEFT